MGRRGINDDEYVFEEQKQKAIYPLRVQEQINRSFKDGMPDINLV